MNREILVYADWTGLGGPRRMGILRTAESRGKEIFSFAYDESWLHSGEFPLLDPALQFFEGPQYLPEDGGGNFGIFLDSSPDRWGRVLMRRREAALARRDGRKVPRLAESDFLLGVHDEQRLGALRFRLEPGGHFLSRESEMATPPWTSLRELEQASWRVQDDDAGSVPDALRWLDLLLAPGSSLGGARPKAGVRSPEGDLWIAKFPARNDDCDMGAWEWVAWQLARDAGIRVPEAQLLELSRRHRTFAARRFDRVAGSHGKERLHFASAMTLLGYHEGTGFPEGASYLEIAEIIATHGAEAKRDLEELWRRIVFSIAVRNTDDHLRNHGFVLTRNGWRLSPAYDLNPNPQGHGLSLNINEDDNSLEFGLALEVSPLFRLKRPAAEEILSTVRKSVSRWRDVATASGIPKGEQEEMRRAFEAD
jgi:serine/threonine-protein kinase HipA